MGRCKNQRRNLDRQLYGRIGLPQLGFLPSPTLRSWAFPWMLFPSSWGVEAGRAVSRVLCLGTFWLWSRRNSNLSHPALYLCSLKNPTSEDFFFFFRFELRFIFAFHPISSWKFDEKSPFSISQWIECVVYLQSCCRNAVCIVGLSITACFQVKQYR